MIITPVLNPGNGVGFEVGSKIWNDHVGVCVGAFVDIVEGSAVTGGALKTINFNTPNESRLYESTKQFVAKANTCWISTPLNLVTLKFNVCCIYWIDRGNYYSFITFIEDRIFNPCDRNRC